MTEEQTNDNSHKQGETDHRELTEQEYRWCMGHLNEAIDQLERAAKLVGKDVTGESEFAEAHTILSSYKQYLQTEVYQSFETGKNQEG